MGLNMNIVAATATILLGVAVGLPLVDLSQTEEEMKFQPLPISMSIAVEAAETATAGQAINAQLQLAEGRPVYEIYMLGMDLNLSKVQVDAQDGEVAVVVDEQQQQPKREQIAQPHQEGGTI